MAEPLSRLTSLAVRIAAIPYRTVPEIVLAFFILLPLMLGLPSSLPYCKECDGPGPTFGSKTVLLSYPGHYTAMDTVDFRNFDLPKLDAAGKPAGFLRIKDGHFRFDDAFDHFQEDIESVHLLPARAGVQRALVLCGWFEAGGSSSQGSKAYLFVLTPDHRLECRQIIEWDTHFNNNGVPTHLFDGERSSLTIRSAHYLPGDAHCCVSAVDVVQFRWTGNLFVPGRVRSERISFQEETH